MLSDLTTRKMSKEKREKKTQEEKISVTKIREIFQEMFMEQQRNISQLIEKNVKVYTDEIATQRKILEK